MIKVESKADFSDLKRMFKYIVNKDYLNILHKYGKIGVEALSEATPIDTGKTAASWDYKIVDGEGQAELIFVNTNTVANGYVNIAIILQYGHATRHGGWVKGRDYINPALKPVFDKLAEDLWKEVTR